MEPRKLTSADIDKVRHIEGFPIATDDAIIELSDAPYYTACPNPFIEEFLAENGTPYNEEDDDYHREPFTADISEGKNDPIYNAHSYHTKVPFKAIMRYILHYTEPGDVVFDGFAGTGMTGVAAQMCGDSNYRYELPGLNQKRTHWGTRNAVLSDLSTFAALASHCYNKQFDIEAFLDEADRIVALTRQKYGWMFAVDHQDPLGRSSLLETSEHAKGDLNYFVFSETFICPNCSNEFVFWDAAVDEQKGKVKSPFSCPHCGRSLTKKQCSPAYEDKYDQELGEVVHTVKKRLVQVNYTYAGKRYDRAPVESDYKLLERIEQEPMPGFVAHNRMCDGSESRRNDKYGVTHVHHFFERANLIVMSFITSQVDNELLLCCLLDIFPRASKMHKIAISRLNTNLSKTAGVLSGTLYIPTNSIAYSAIYMFESRIKDVARALNMFKVHGNVIVSNQSTTDFPNLPDNCIDYIFTDPPFGANLNYSELNYLTESWMQVITNNGTEAIVNPAQNKNLPDYQALMRACFDTYYRVLKPGRWITVEFHNSKNAVWNAIQEAISAAGFIVADVRTLDKKQTSFKQANSFSAVKQDLIISAYKPSREFQREMIASAGSSETAWYFVQQHLANIPIVVVDGDRIEVIAERQAYLLFDRMVAYHVTQGLPVPLDATDFYRGLDERFVKRDEMYFLSDQITEYDTTRLKMDVESIEFALLVTNEKTAIGWLYSLLTEKPRTYAEIQPLFMQEVKTVDRYEDIPELQVLLEENFLQDEKGRWYVPDTKKEGDIAKLREKSLLREFDGYLKSKGKLKLFRSEAIRVGFSHLWKDKNYQAIVDLANRLPAATIQEDPNLLMYYDISLSRVG